ncbi:MAG: SPOR domain-containing protein [Methylocystis sp.]|nr:SPOR domain-containing protein [Methylocystis sp.]
MAGGSSAACGGTPIAAHVAGGSSAGRGGTPIAAHVAGGAGAGRGGTPIAAHVAGARHFVAADYPSERHDDSEVDWSFDETQAFIDYGAQPSGDPATFAGAGALPEGGGRRLRVRPWHAVTGIAVIGAVSVGWGLAHRGGGTPREIATISAPNGPAKVQPKAEADEGAGAPQQGAAVLDRTESALVSKVISHEEQPVDPAAAQRVVSVGAAPVDAPHGLPAFAANSAQINSLAPEPKKVKTVSVRPDGSVIANDSVPPAVTEPAPPALSAAHGPSGDGAKADGAEADAPAHGVTPKIAAKPATTPRPARPAARAKPAKLVSAANPEANDAAGDAPTQPAATDGAAGGAYAVQFGAAGSEAEARQLMQKITAQYSSQLGGRRLGYYRAKVGDKTVYRVRAGVAGKEAAVGICDQVKSAGGSCFVAGN